MYNSTRVVPLGAWDNFAGRKRENPIVRFPPSPPRTSRSENIADRAIPNSSRVLSKLLRTQFGKNEIVINYETNDLRVTATQPSRSPKKADYIFQRVDGILGQNALGSVFDINFVHLCRNRLVPFFPPLFVAAGYSTFFSPIPCYHVRRSPILISLLKNAAELLS